MSEVVSGGYTPADWKRAKPAWDYLWKAMEASPTYGWWYSGDVPATLPAWADNSAPPAPDEILEVFCAGVGNLMIRALEMFDEGYIIPTSGWEQYDGGTVAWYNYYASYGTLEPFDLQFAQTHSGTMCLRAYRDANNDQGHWMVTYKGWAVQSYPSGGSLEPGLNWDHTVESSHGYGYYEYMVKPWDWLPITEQEYYGNATDGNNGIPTPMPERKVLTPELLRKAMSSPSFAGPDLTEENAKRYFEPFIKMCKKYEINTRARIAAFLAISGGETGSWTWMHEIGEGGGRFGAYYGRGFVQLTWLGNYQRYQDDSGYPVVDDPDMVANDPVVAADSGGWFWRRGAVQDLNPLADSATWEDFGWIVGLVWGTGASTPEPEKDARYQHAWDTIPEGIQLEDTGVGPPPPPPPPPTFTRANYLSINKDGIAVLGGQDWSGGWIWADPNDLEAGIPTPLLYVPQYLTGDSPIPVPNAKIDETIRFAGEGDTHEVSGEITIKPREDA